MQLRFIPTTFNLLMLHSFSQGVRLYKTCDDTYIIPLSPNKSYNVEEEFQIISYSDILHEDTATFQTLNWLY